MIFQHRQEGNDDMAAHIRTALTQVHLSIPVVGGVPVLGTWQGVFLYEHRYDPQRRKVMLHLIGE
jgi:secondary thiamine-phosphate synthase enzyme